MGNTHSQGIVSAGSASGPDAHARADTHKQSAQNAGSQGHIRKTRPQGWEMLADPICGGKCCRGDRRIADKLPAQQLPPHQKAACVHEKAGNSGGNIQPVIQQQRQSQHTALCHGGNGMYMIQPKGQERAARDNNGTVFRLQPRKQNQNPFLFYKTVAFPGAVE